jgi:transcriptional regulator with XRE-family HTH domain
MMISRNKKLEVGKRIEKLRLSKNMSQLQFGGSIDCEQSRISSYERGELLIRTVDLINISRVYNISPNYLLFGYQEDKNGETEAEKEREKVKVEV